MKKITFEDIKADEEIRTYINKSYEYLGHMGFTEHGIRHSSIIAKRSKDILQALGRNERTCELASIAGFMHDIGNMLNRDHHGNAGALMSFQILSRMGMPPDEIATVLSAIGNHEEERGHAVNDVAAALILADKSDVHRTRVHNREVATFDIHDRVNYAAQQSKIVVNQVEGTVALELEIDVKICPVMEYFEIFLERMMMCRRAATFLDLKFKLVINNNQLL